MKESKKTSNLDKIRRSIQKTHLLFIIVLTILLSTGGAFINIKSNEKSFTQSQKETSELITRIYSFIDNYNQQNLSIYMDSIVKNLEDVDVVSIIDENGYRIYHTNHNLINTLYDGKTPDFSYTNQNSFTENSSGPSGLQLRTYSAIFDENGNYKGFIIVIRLKTSIMQVTFKTILMFLVVTLGAILIELAISKQIFSRIKKAFLMFTEDFEGTKFLVDSMRANNHDFTNKLHVILGLIQIGQYDKAISYIENISIIQKETISHIMKAIDNPSFAALLIGKIARASECNVKFILQDNIKYKSDDIDIPSEALVTITGNLIDNALDAMNFNQNDNSKELIFGVFTIQGSLLLTVQDNGCGISDDIRAKIFDKGFSTKGENRGVGLYHTKQLVESLGGIITFESQKDNGSCFMVNLKNK